MYLYLVLLAAVLTYLFEDLVMSQELYFEHFGQQMSFERIEKMLDFKQEWQWLNYAVMPVIYLIKFTLISFWLLCGTVLFGYKVSFKQIFQLTIKAEFVWLVPYIITIIWFGVIDRDYTLLDVQYFQPLSLINIFNAETLDSWLVFPLKSINIFEIIYMLVLALGMKNILDKDLNGSLSFVLPVYGTGLVSWIAFITFLSINLMD